jgi:hypothetical protein
VFYADSAAKASQLAREGESQHSPDVDPELLLSYFLGQLIYDTDDRMGIYSAMRGHSLARIMYGLTKRRLSWDPAFARHAENRPSSVRYIHQRPDLQDRSQP